MWNNNDDEETGEEEKEQDENEYAEVVEKQETEEGWRCKGQRWWIRFW